MMSSSVVRLALQTKVKSIRFRSSSLVSRDLSMKLCVVGGGNMAESIISALHKGKSQAMHDVSVYDVNDSRLQYLSKKYGVYICSSVEEGMIDADVTLLSVKPQNVSTIANSITVTPKGLILSIVAGCTIDTLKETFKTDRIVRSMPNTPGRRIYIIYNSTKHVIYVITQYYHYHQCSCYHIK